MIDLVNEDTAPKINYQEYGIYYDDLSRIDGEWKFTHRGSFRSTYYPG